MTANELLQHLRETPFVLAPMAGITDRPFRSFMREMGCGIVVTELVSATGFKYSPAKTLRLMEFDSLQHPIGIQLFGEDLEHLALAAIAAEDLGADFVDLNFGCPVPKVVNRGAGSACLKDLVKLRDVIRTVRRAVRLPVTIKIRTGWDENTRNSHAVAEVAADEGVTWIAIHGRTRSAGYSGAADWEYIAEVKARSPLPVLGNGDIVSARQAVERLRESGCDGVMIGRGCLKNPRLFQQAKALWAGEASARDEAMEMLLARLCGHLDAFYDERLTLIQMRKFAAWYSSGFPGAAGFRKELFQLQGRDLVLARIRDFFRGLEQASQMDTSHEPFLMGGHG